MATTDPPLYSIIDCHHVNYRIEQTCTLTMLADYELVDNE